MWTTTDEKLGMFCKMVWENQKFPHWKIVERMTESGGIRFDVINTHSGSAIQKSFPTFRQASMAVRQYFKTLGVV